VRQAIDILKRRKWAFIIPFTIVFVVPVLWTLLFMRSYESDALVWLDSDVSIVPVLSQDGAAPAAQGTPIQNEADTLQQLLQSRAFVTKVIAKTPLNDKMDNAKEREATINFVRRNLSSAVVGPNALRISFFGRTPSEAVTVVKATTGTFLEWVRGSVSDQNDKAVAFFETQSNTYQDELNTASTQLRKYKERHPETEQLEQRDKVLNQVKVTASPTVQIEFERLRSQLDYAQKLYDGSLDDLAKTRVLASAQQEKYVNGLRVVDNAIAPTGFSKKRFMLATFMSFMAACLIGALAVMIAELSDRTIRSERDVTESLDLPVLVEIKQREFPARQA
jgi:uncharacterized protein involved in exopolysaccharide biosynthesis